jgi:hypothetical protein
MRLSRDRSEGAVLIPRNDSTNDGSAAYEALARHRLAA